MKRLWVAVAFLAVAISMCVFEQYTVATTYRQATDIIDTAIDESRQNNYKSAEKYCAELDDYWDSRQKYLEPIIDHGALDEAGMTISVLEGLAESKSDSLTDELITAKYQVKAIYEDQKITLGNIF